MKTFTKHPDLFFARLYYFTFMGGWGFILPFMNLFYVSLGLSGTQIGTIASTSAVVGLVSAPVWVNEVKRHPRARMLLQVALAMGAAGYFLIGKQVAYLPIVGIVFLQSLAASGIMPLSDSMAVTVAQDSGSGYGSVRVWASLGWIFSVLASGWLIERFGFGAGFAGVSLGLLTAIFVLFFIAPRYFTSHDAPTSQPKMNLKDAIRAVLSDSALAGFALALIAVGFLNNGVLQFENVFLAELGASKQLISIAGTLSAIVELPFMIWADRIVRRVGPHRLMLIALGLTFFQRATVFLLPAIATIMVVRFIGGVAFSFYTISFVGLISSRTSPTQTGTVLALFTVTISGLVNIIAAPVMGSIFDAIGARWLYALAMGGYAIALTSLWLTRPRETHA